YLCARGHGLLGGREYCLGEVLDLRQGLESRLVRRPGLGHCAELDRACPTLEPDVLTLDRVEELLPEASGRRMRGVLAHGLVIEPAERDALRVDDLPVRRAGQTPGAGGVQVVPVESDRTRGRDHRGCVAVGRI